jgi:hypothetical protein
MPDDTGYHPRRTLYRRDEALAVLSIFEGDPFGTALRPLLREPSAFVATMWCQLFPADQDDTVEDFQFKCYTPRGLRDRWRRYLQPPYKGNDARPTLSLSDWATVRAGPTGTMRWHYEVIEDPEDPAGTPVLSMVVNAERLTAEMVRSAVQTVLSERGGLYATFTTVWDESPSPAYVTAVERFRYWEEMAVWSVGEPEERRRLAFADQVWVHEVLPLTASLAATRVCTVAPGLTAMYEAYAASLDVSFADRILGLRKQLEDEDDIYERYDGDIVAYRNLREHDTAWSTDGVVALRDELETLRLYAQQGPTLSIEPMLDWLTMMDGEGDAPTDVVPNDVDDDDDDDARDGA